MDAYEALQKAYSIIEKARHEVAALGIEASKLSWDAKDGFNGADDHLSDAESEIGHAMTRIEEKNPEPDETAELLRDYYASTGCKTGRSAA